jgi:hypothetical protein
MENKKRVMVLVAIALILATTAIVLNLMDSEILTTRTSSQGEQTGGGEVGVEIQSPQVEDRLEGDVSQ